MASFITSSLDGVVVTYMIPITWPLSYNGYENSYAPVSITGRGKVLFLLPKHHTTHIYVNQVACTVGVSDKHIVILFFLYVEQAR